MCKPHLIFVALGSLLLPLSPISAQPPPTEFTANCVNALPPPQILSGSPINAVCFGLAADGESILINQLWGVSGGNNATTGATVEPSDLGKSDAPQKNGKTRVQVSLQCLQYTCPVPCTAYVANPVPNCPVKFEFTPIPGEGAHDSGRHALRPRGEISTMSKNDNTATAANQNFYSYTPVAGEVNNFPRPPTESSVSYQTNENAAGDPVQISYATPEASGLVQLTLTAFAGQTPDVTYSVNLNIGISNLVQQSFYTAPNGGSWQIVSPAANSDKRHLFQNDFANSTTVGMMNNGATYFAELLSKASLGNETIRITEMSLPQGGMFDLNGKFHTARGSGNGHVTHRRGLEIDFALASTYVKQAIEDKALKAAGFVLLVPKERFEDCGLDCRANGVTHFHGLVPNAQLLLSLLGDPTSFTTDS